MKVLEDYTRAHMPVKNPTTTQTPSAPAPLAELEALLPQCMLQERVRLETQLKKLRRRRKPHPGELERLVRRATESTRLLQQRRRKLPAVHYPEELPITARKNEILQAIRRIVEDGIPAEQVDEPLLQEYLYTAAIPDPDLIIRTAGEMRLSNFLLW